MTHFIELSTASNVRVGAVVVTYNRPEELRGTVCGVLEQTHRPDYLVVVDNGQDSNVRTIVRELSESFAIPVDYVDPPENVGYGAALSIGMRHLRERCDPDLYWLLDDDTPPRAGYLKERISICLPYSSAPAVIANRGGTIKAGIIRHRSMESCESGSVDYTLVDGTLITRAAVESAGYPRTDLFMMFEDIEYTTRIRELGGVLIVRESQIEPLHLGSGSVWRVFYQSRNHLRVAIDRRSVAWVFGWFFRIIGGSLYDIRARDWLRFRLRWMGAYHGLSNRMGHAIQPRLLKLMPDR